MQTLKWTTVTIINVTNVELHVYRKSLFNINYDARDPLYFRFLTSKRCICHTFKKTLKFSQNVCVYAFGLTRTIRNMLPYIYNIDNMLQYFKFYIESFLEITKYNLNAIHFILFPYKLTKNKQPNFGLNVSLYKSQLPSHILYIQ